MKKKIFIFISCVLIIFGISTETKAYSNDPKQFITEIIEEAKKILNEPGATIETKAEKLSKIAVVTVDVRGLGYYTLGGYRKELNEEQLKKYITLFEKYFLKSFTSRLSDYSDPKIEVLSSEILNPKYTMVKTLLLATTKKPEVKIDWRVYTKDPTNPLIRDLIIEGLSLARTQREEFASVIESNNGDVTKLFETLEEFIAQ